MNNPKILSNDSDQVPKTGERYEKELNSPELHSQIIEAFDKEETKENPRIDIASEDFIISKPENTGAAYANKKLTDNGDVRETYSNGICLQKFTFDAAKREVEKAGKSLLKSATIFQDLFINKYKGDKEAFIKGENLSVTKLSDGGFDIGPGFLYVFADGSVFTMYNTDVVQKRKENEFFGIYKDNANSNNLKDYLYSIRLAK